MMAMTTNNSIRVKPLFWRIRSPLFVGDAVEALAMGQRIHVEYVFAFVRALGGTVIRAQSPAVPVVVPGRDEGITRQTSQEIELGALGATHVTHALHQHLQAGRKAVAADGLFDVPGIGCTLVGIDGIAK